MFSSPRTTILLIVAAFTLTQIVSAVADGNPTYKAPSGLCSSSCSSGSICVDTKCIANNYIGCFASNNTTWGYTPNLGGMQSMANVPLISTFCGPSSPYWALYNGGSTLPSIRCGCQLFALANQVDNSNCSRMCYSSSAYCGSLSQSTQAGTPVYFAVYKNANYDMTNATSCFLSDPKNCGSIGWQCLDSSSCVNGACYKPGGGSSTTGNSTTLNGGSSGSNSTSSGGSSGNTSGSSTAGNNTGSAGGGPAGNNGSGTLSDTCNGKQCPVDYPKCWMGGCINPNISNSACGIDMKPCSFDKPNCIGGTCKNILTDANNCGSLGHKCGNQLPDCSNGTCTNYQSDNTNCGKAGAICDLDQNQICSGGTCKSLDDQNIVTPCVPLPDGTNLMECQNYGACTPHGQCIINPNNNPQFCGTLIPASGISCLGPNPICLLGKCFNTVPAPNNTCTQTCPSANSTCYNKVCIDLNNDPYNCGKLSNVCPSTSPTCVYGSCTNTLTDKNNCGAPNNVCPPLAPNCSVGFCNNIMNDTSNCGMHGNQCDGSQGVCIQGKCSCVTGWALDPTSSVNGCFKPNLLTDPKNCGTIGNLCKDYTWYCGNGTCINPSSNPQFCGTMLSPVVACVLPNPDCANGACTNFASSSLNCGSTGNKCGGGSSCSGGVCTCSSGLSYITTAKNCVPQDCAILVTTFPSIWDGKTSCCNQNPKPGVNVICNSNNGVTDLTIDNQSSLGLSTIPSTLGQLPFLTYLEMNGDKLIGNIPTSLCQLSKLETLNVSNNTLSGLPSCLSNLPSLSTLDVSNNLKLNGSIPSWLCQMNLNVWNGINTSLTPNGALPMSFNLDGATISTLQSTFSAGNPQFCCGDSTRTSMPNYCQSPTGDCALDASKKIFCTNLTIDSSNCQIPGNVCPNNFVCTPDGCADLSSNATSCGTYGNTCPPFYGDDGQNYGSTCISSVCKNTYNDSTCCGIQQAVCDSKSICKKGLCQCNPVTQSGPFWAIDNNSSTNPNCIDTSANLTSCGLTLIQCTLSALNCTMKTPCKPTCSNGTCFNSFDPKSCGGLNQVCTNPTPDCANGICTNFQNDTLNCGGQSKACPPNNVCSRGKCYNLNTDTLNCGVVGSPCNNTTGTVSCVNGACLCSMSSNSTPLNYTVAGCKNFNSDVNNCGALNQQCTSTGLNCQSLSSSTCQPTCIQGQCFNTATDNSHCGLSNKKCSAPSSICSNGNCIPSDCVIVDALFPSLWSVGTNCCANGHISSNVNLVCNAYNQVTNITIGNQPLTSIPDLSGLTALQSLTLTGDNLSNSIPSSICSITTLKSLVLSNNALNGEMPQCLSTLPLSDLVVANSTISGTIPSWLCSIPSLVHWDGSGSNLQSNGALQQTYSNLNVPLVNSKFCCGAGTANTCAANQNQKPDCVINDAGVGSCTDFQTDIYNCGFANNVCKNTLSTNYTCYGGKCIDRNSDNMNCGDLGKICKGVSVCSSGKCSCTSADFTYFNDQCYNFKNDNLNCGAFNVTCGTDANCKSGICTCISGSRFYFAAGKCHNSDTDPQYCGNSNINCTSLPSTPNCANGICTDFQADKNNCGGVAIACNGNSSCIQGQCQCTTPGYKYSGVGANGVCLNLNSDPQNCGLIGNKCDASQGKLDCVPTKFPTNSLTAYCTNIQTDPYACGMGLATCTGNAPVCSGGNCVPQDCVTLAQAFPAIWPNATNCCGFNQVQCDSNSNVISVILQNQQLTGSLNNSICSLQKLQLLNVASNFLTGSLPLCFSQNSSLTTLIVSQNTQLGNNAPPPAWLCQLPGLTKWDGTNSNFTQLLSYDSTSQTPVTPLSKSAVCCAGVLNPCNSTILPNCITGFNGTAQCVNFLSDNNHCGNANTQCSAVGPCLNGQCIDLTNDPQHCGSLTTVCDQYSTCTNSKCVCNSNSLANGRITIGNGSCIDPSSNPLYCGNNVAQVACDSSSICSKGQCINTQIDPFNCGAPGISCKNATTCNAGTCVPNSCIPYINIWNLWPPGSNCCTTNSTIPGVSLICNSDYTVNTLAVIGNNNTPPIPTSGNNNTNPSSSGSSADSNTQALCSLVNTNLISLTLNNYPVIKQLPDCLCKAPNLTNIILPNNNLIGNIPDCFQNLPLVQLQLANNTGLGSNSQSIPSWLCAIPTLLLWDSTADALVQNSALPIQYNGMQTYTSLQKSSYCCKNAPNPCPASTPTCLVTPSGIGCTNLQKDPSNCGTIGNLCNNYSPYCSSGNCSSSPTGAATLCSSGSIWNIIQQRCISISTDTGNCGLLNYDCSAISPTSKCINGQCYDVSKDNYNCGTVGIKCNSTSTCVNGVCTQSTSYTDPTACGGKKCLNDWYVCKKITMKLSSCVPNCPLTWKYDPATNQCLNLLRDVHNCGQCNTTCTGMVPQCFGGNCYDFGVDSNNCGFYNNVCPDGLTCLWGICQ